MPFVDRGTDTEVLIFRELSIDSPVISESGSDAISEKNVSAKEEERSDDLRCHKVLPPQMTRWKANIVRVS